MKKCLLMLVVILSGCAVGYQPYNSMSGGYKDEKLGENRYRVEYHIFAPAYADRVEGHWHTRAAELCPSGYEVISIEREDTTTNTAVMSGGVLMPVSSSEPRAIGEIKCKDPE